MSETEQEQTEPESPEEAPPTPDEHDEEGEAEEQESLDQDEVEGVRTEEQHAEDAARNVGMGEKEIEAMHKKLGTARNAYVKKLEGILGDEIQMLEMCPRCIGDGIAGFIFPPQLHPVDDETRTAVLASIGETPADATERDPFSRRCEICDGSGVVLTGSKRNAEKVIVCLECKGRGWVAVGDERRVAQQAVAVPQPSNGVEQLPEPAPDTDPWGRGPGDPDYGRLPQFVGH